jgi:hypothetical protein
MNKEAEAVEAAHMELERKRSGLQKKSISRPTSAYKMRMYPAFKESHQKYGERMAEKCAVVDASFQKLGVAWNFGQEPSAITGAALNDGCRELRRMTLAGELSSLPLNVRTILKKDNLTARDCAVALRRLAKWSGLAVLCKKLQSKKTDGSYQTTMMYIVR